MIRVPNQENRCKRLEKTGPSLPDFRDFIKEIYQMDKRKSTFAPLEAKWIWLPAGRTLPNTFALFRFSFDLKNPPSALKGFICADSRYELRVNGERAQWGPAPSDPRRMEADPFDLAPYLEVGKNTIAIRVLYYGNPEGTWPFGKPGLIFWSEDGSLASNENWKCMVDRSQKPGSSPRWYLRSLQEQRDLRLEPLGWDQADFNDSDWLTPRLLSCSSQETPSGGIEGIYHQDWVIWGTGETILSERSIPMMKEALVDLGSPVDSHRLVWSRSPDDWFDFRIPCFNVQPCQAEATFSLKAGEGRAFRFDLEKEAIGFPWLELTAPEGTIVELICQESVNPKHEGWLENHFHLWSRFICREGFNRLEAFDYEAVKHLQIHLHGAVGEATIHTAGVRIREFDWSAEPEFEVSDPELQKLFEANVQTFRNSIQDIVVDGMARERQQYSGDCGHQLALVQPLFGTSSVFAKYLRTYAMGQLPSGVFMDSWPCADRLNRLWQKPFGLSSWGPIVDHSIGFCFDHFNYWMNSGDLELIHENWAKLMKFAQFIADSRSEGILDAVAMAEGSHSVWIDHLAFRNQKEKSLALTLYAAAAMSHALSPLAMAIGKSSDGDWLKRVAEKMVDAAQAKWWRTDLGVFVNDEDGRMDDRSLATALIFDQAPNGGDEIARVLAEMPDNLGLSYPANTPWLYWALAKSGNVQKAIQDLRARWTTLPSVQLNGTIQEMWDIELGGIHLMSHCAAGPLTVLYHGILGLKSIQPGFSEYELSPTLAGLGSVKVTAHLPQGVLVLELNSYECTVQAPEIAKGVLLLNGRRQDLQPGKLNRFSI